MNSFPLSELVFINYPLPKRSMRFNTVLCVLGNAADSHTFHFIPCLQMSPCKSVCVSPI